MTSRARVAIHGFGRIGRQTFKNLLEGYADRIEVAMHPAPAAPLW